MTSTPQTGDVIVQKRTATPPNTDTWARFELNIVGRPKQYLETTYEQALNRADSFARHAHVDVWYSEDGSAFRSITRRRQPLPTSSGTPAR